MDILGTVTLSFRMTKDQFASASLFMTYNRRYKLLLLGIAAVVLFRCITDDQPIAYLFRDNIWRFMIFVLWAVCVPVWAYFAARRNFEGSTAAKGILEYHFDYDTMHIKGIDFDRKVAVSSLYEIVEHRHWFLVYYAKGRANIIPKGGLRPEQVSEFRYFLSKLDNVKVKLIK